MSTRRPFDPVRFIEAVYDLQADDEQWLRGIAEAAHPDLDDGLGVSGYCMRLPGPDGSGHDRPMTLSVVDGDPELHFGMLAQMAPRMDRDHLPALYDALTFTTASELSPLDDFHQNPLFKQHAHPHGIYDFIGLTSPDPAGLVAVIGAPQREVRAINPARRRLWKQLGVHMAAAFRLRCAIERRELEGLERLEPDAVLTPQGRIVHANEATALPSVREALRESAQAMDQARGALRATNPAEAVNIWRALVSARWTLLDTFEQDGRRYFVARRNTSQLESPTELSPREQQVVQLVARGYSNKLAGYALGLSASTVATHLHRAMRKLRVDSRVELIQLIRALELVGG